MRDSDERLGLETPDPRVRTGPGVKGVHWGGDSREGGGEGRRDGGMDGGTEGGTEGEREGEGER